MLGDKTQSQRAEVPVHSTEHLQMTQEDGQGGLIQGVWWGRGRGEVRASSTRTNNSTCHDENGCPPPLLLPRIQVYLKLISVLKDDTRIHMLK